VHALALSQQSAGRGVAAGTSLSRPEPTRRGEAVLKAATEWLDRPRDPKDGLGVGFAPDGDPRRNSFDWEAWHECDVFRAITKSAKNKGKTNDAER
jgi:hypothetical protein